MCPLEVYKTLINIVNVRYEKWRAVSWKGKLIKDGRFSKCDFCTWYDSCHAVINEWKLRMKTRLRRGWRNWEKPRFFVVWNIREYRACLNADAYRRERHWSLSLRVGVSDGTRKVLEEVWIDLLLTERETWGLVVFLWNMRLWRMRSRLEVSMLQVWEEKKSLENRHFLVH